MGPFSVFICLNLLFFLILPSSASSVSSLPYYSASARRVLLLGSGGLIGSALADSLRAHNYSVVEIRDRKHFDLRRSTESLAEFVAGPISFVFFLACEVGGSKFIDSTSSSVQLSIIESNILIYQSVIRFLAARGLPYLFSSSYLQFEATGYGAVKRLGEAWIAAANSDSHAAADSVTGSGSVTGVSRGKVVRLWNIYGPERLSVKSHVLTDWISQCLGDGSRIHSLTDGLEFRQFLHSSDTANAMRLMMENFDEIDFVSDLSSNRWISLRDAGSLITGLSEKLFSRPCEIQFSQVQARVRDKIEPNMQAKFYQLGVWKQTIPFESGLESMFRALSKEKVQVEILPEFGQINELTPTQTQVKDDNEIVDD